MRKLSFVLCAAMALSGLSACSMPLTDDIGNRGRTGAVGRDTTQYRVVDNAIYDTLVEMYGKDRVELAEGPEVEFHRWQVRSDVIPEGHSKKRVRIQVRPLLDFDDQRYHPDVRVWTEYRKEPWGNMSQPSALGARSWIKAGSNKKTEAKIENEVNRKVRAWNAKGGPVGNRRDAWLDARESTLESSAAGK